MLDDRMESENLKEVAASIMGQTVAPGVSGGDNAGTEHPDTPFAKSLFEERDAVPQQSATTTPALDLSPLSNSSGNSQQSIREDLVQQAAQSLVRDQNDAFLAISSRMTPDEVMLTLKTAKQWRRPDPDWQDTFRGAPETGFKFIDRNSGAAKKKVKGGGNAKNKAESLALSIVEFMRQNRLAAEEAPKVVRQIVRERGIRMTESQLALFAGKVGNMV